MKKTIDVQQGFDVTGHCVYTVRKARGKLTLDEIREAMTEYAQDYYGLVLKCMDEDISQYYDDDLLGDGVELYSIESILEEWGKGESEMKKEQERERGMKVKKSMDDQAAKQDAGKPKLSLVPPRIIRDIAEVREYGNRKYGRTDNWRNVEKQRYIDALYRHLLAYIDDQNGVDEESGIRHYKHIACNMAFICAMEAEKS